MIDLTPVWNKIVTMNEFAASLSLTDLRRLTENAVDHVLALLADADDAAVSFVPTHQEQHNAAANASVERMQGWTIARVVVHATASAEEYALLAARVGPWRAAPRTLA